MTKDEIKILVAGLRNPPLEHGGISAPILGYEARQNMRDAANLIEELVKEVEAVNKCS